MLKITTLVGVVFLGVFASTKFSSQTAAFLNSLISSGSNPVQAGTWTPPDAPIFWVEEDTSQVKLDWFASTSGNAVAYKVYRSTDNVTFTPIATLGNVTTYTDSTVSSGQNYYYKVTALDSLNNENQLSDITAKYAGPKDIVIDDDTMTGGADLNNSGTVTVGSGWDKYAVKSNGSDGVNAVPSILQNAVGGDNYSTSNPATGQTFDWTTNTTLNGNYEIFAEYICDPSRGNATYTIFSGATQVGSPVTKAQNLLSDGTSCGSQGSGNTESHWVSLGIFPIIGQGRVHLLAQAGQAYILADAVAFQRISDITTAPVVHIDPAAAQITNGYACGIGSALPNDELKVTVTNWQSNYKLQLRYKVAGGGYNSFADASSFGMTPTISGGVATFELQNSGDSPAGAAGWQAQVVDISSNAQIVGSNTDEMTYIITTDTHALACGGSIGSGFESAETIANTGDGNPALGFCSITSADRSQPNDFATQVIKWNQIAFATQYRLTKYVFSGGNWTQSGAPIVLAANTLIINSGVVSYTTSQAPSSTTAYLIEALDDSNNVLGRTTPQTPPFTCTFTTNQVLPPISYITVSNSSDRKIENRIQNGSFESGLTNWNVSGDATLVTGSDGFTAPEDGNNMVRVGRTTNEGNPARLNVLSQQIPAGVRAVGFYYNMFTYDQAGFDNPGFMVFVNDKMVFQRWASEIDKDNPALGVNNLDSSGWQYFGVDLSAYPEGTNLTLAFYAGNDNANISSTQPHQTWVYLDNFSTNEAIVNHNSVFTIHTHPGDTAHYMIGSDPTVHTGTTFQLDSQPAGEKIYYWSSNSTGNEAINLFHVLYDNTPPQAITDLAGEHVTTTDPNSNLFSLTWTSPRDDNQFTSGSPFTRPTSPASYDIRYSTATISATTDWNSLTPVTIVTEDGLPYGGLRAPRPEHEQEQYFVRPTTSANDYYFAVKSADAATNTSDISNVAHVSLTAPAVINNHSDIVINEFLPNPSSAPDAAKPNGQWVELYNKNSTDIDVNGWALYDNNDAHELIISSANGDNNLNPADSGETVVPAHGWLVVYRNGNPNFALDTTGGDSVRLFDKPMSSGGTLIDSYTYTVDAPVGKSFARIPDGSGSFVDPVPTPGRQNAASTDQLQPEARIWNQTTATAKIGIFDAVNYTAAHYVVEYSYNDGTEKQGGMVGDVQINNSQDVEKTDLYFGTCSTGGTCVPNAGVEPNTITLIVTLTGNGIPDRTIKQTLTGNWQ